MDTFDKAETRKGGNYNEEVELEILKSDYEYFLICLFVKIKEKCEKNSYLWFDKCRIEDFFVFAYDPEISTGPPKNV